MLFRKISAGRIWEEREEIGSRKKNPNFVISLFPRPPFGVGSPFVEVEGFQWLLGREERKRKFPKSIIMLRGRFYYFLRTGYYLEGWGNEEGIFVVRGNWKQCYRKYCCNWRPTVY